MNKYIIRLVLVLGMVIPASAFATGLATCDEPESEWQSQDVLQKQLEEKGWKIRRIKVDGGCYEVYAMNDKGERVEAYFNPRTLESIPIDESKRRH